MKNKIQAAMSALTLAALSLPALVSAQGFTIPAETHLPTGGVQAIIISIMNWLLIVVGVFGVIGFVIAGILYLTSAGDETRIETAKKAMLYSIIGVIVALVGVVILQAAKNMLNASTSF